MIIDYETQEPIICQTCGEKEKLAIVEFVFGSRVDCSRCGTTVA